MNDVGILVEESKDEEELDKRGQRTSVNLKPRGESNADFTSNFSIHYSVTSY